MPREFKPLLTLEDVQGTDTDSLLFKALEFIDRPRAAVFGGVQETLTGGDPIRAIGQALSGAEDFRGKEVLAALGADPETKLTKGVGIASEFVGDPLNLVGIGALTKLGKGAKILKGFGTGVDIGRGTRLATEFGEQARRGQRSLISFGGQTVLPDIPLPFAEQTGGSVLQALQNLGRGIRGTRAARQIEAKIGGVKGIRRLHPELFEGQNENMARILDEATVAREQVEKSFTLAQGEFSDILTAMDRTKGRQLINTIELLNRGDIDIDGALTAWNVSPEKSTERIFELLGRNNAILPDDLKAIRDDKEMREGFRAWLESKNLQDRFDRALSGEVGPEFDVGPFGHVTRKIKAKKAGFEDIATGEPQDFIPQTRPHIDFGDGVIRNPDGSIVKMPVEENNIINRGLVPGSFQPVRYGESASAVGITGQPARATIQELASTEVDQLGRLKPLPKGFGPQSPFFYEQNVAAIHNEMVDQASKRFGMTAFVDNLLKHDVAKVWDDGIHKPGEWMKVRYGKWAQKPVAVPKQIDEMLKAHITRSTPDNAMQMIGSGAGGGVLREYSAWFKSMAIGFNFGGFQARNFASAMMKNFVEGLGPMNPQTFRMYGMASDIVKRKFTNLRNPMEGYINIGGVQWHKERLFQEYWQRGMDGGGGLIGQSLSPDATIDLMNGTKGLPSRVDPDRIPFFSVESSQRFRKKDPVRKLSMSANDRVEMMARMPLLFKSLEDQALVMRQVGMKVPATMDKIEDGLDIVNQGGVVDGMLQNAKEIVLRTHFDYTDLSDFEKSNWARGFLVPFYSWTRNNLPHETINILTKPGKYVGFARAYRNMWELAQADPENAPPWLRESFAMPMPDALKEKFKEVTGMELGGEQEETYLSLQNYLPFMDVADILTSAFAPREVGGRDAIQRSIREVATQLNPLVTQFPEQGLSKEFFSGKRLDVEAPGEFAGVQVPGGARTVSLVSNLLPAVGAIDRLFGTSVAKKGRELGLIEGVGPEGRRSGRNEPEFGGRLLRQLTGLRFYTPDKDAANETAKKIKARQTRLRGLIRKMKREQRFGEARFYEERLAELRARLR